MFWRLNSYRLRSDRAWIFCDCELKRCVYISTENLVAEYVLKFMVKTELHIGVGLCQGPGLSPLLFFIVFDEVTDDVRGRVPWELT